MTAKKHLERDAALRAREEREVLRGWVEGALLDSSSLRLERIGRSERWRVIIEGEVVDELSQREHPRLVAHLRIIGEEHRAAIEFARRKLIQLDKALAGAREGGRRTAHKNAAQLERVVANVVRSGQTIAPYLPSWRDEFDVSNATIYRLRKKVLAREK